MLTPILAIRRNFDAVPIGGAEFFAVLFGAVANDGVGYELTPPAGAPSLSLDPRSRIRIAWARVEWQTDDPQLPPPLSLQLRVNGAASVAASTLNRLYLQPLDSGTPAMELDFTADVAPGASINVFGYNTGAINPQYLAAYLWGWSYPNTLQEGAGYASR